MKQKFKKLYLILVFVLQSTSSFADLQSEFQQAYQASARILQTARELFEALIKVV